MKKISTKTLLIIILVLLLLSTGVFLYLFLRTRLELKTLNNQITTCTEPLNNDDSENNSETNTQEKYLSTEEAEQFLIDNFNINSTLPENWVYFSTSGDDVMLSMGNEVSIYIGYTFDRGDMCSSDAGTQASPTCYSKTFLTTPLTRYTEYVVNGKIKEIVGNYMNGDKTVYVLVSAGEFLNEEYLDTTEEQTVLNTLKSFQIKD